jgi:hypothetical protein
VSRLLGVLVALMFTAPAMGADAEQHAPLNSTAATSLCNTLASAVDSVPGDGPAFVISYHPGPGEAALPGALSNTAFTYDNALLAIALVGCHDVKQARRIANAIVMAQSHDRTFSDGRVRNAYRAGAVGKPPVALPGFWDNQANRWLEDGYQAGTAIGNVAWAALALLQVFGATSDQQYLSAAERLAAFADDQALDRHDPQGFSGGLSGFETRQERLTWKSTEHNVDMMAVSTWLAEITGEQRWRESAAVAQSFVQAMFHSGEGFEIGTTPDNRPAGYSNVVLDVQLWPSLALAAPPPSWTSALGVAATKLAVGGGFDFNGDRDGLWTEGTAQAALAFHLAGRDKEAGNYLDRALAQAAPGGWLFATAPARITTGLMIEPTGDPFYYYRRPHLGATAWAALAAQGYDPFLPTGGKG